MSPDQNPFDEPNREPEETPWKPAGERENLERIPEGNEESPYRAPSTPYEAPAPIEPSHAVGAYQEWSLTDPLQFGWNCVKKQPIVVAIFLVAQIGMQAVSQGGSVIQTVLGMGGDRDLAIIGNLIYLLAIVVNIFVSAWFMVGMTRVQLRVASGGDADFADLFNAGGHYWRALGATLLYYLMIGIPAGLAVGLAAGLAVNLETPIPFFVVIPPLFVYVTVLGLGLLFYLFLLIDQNCGPVESLRQSWKLTKGHKGKLFVFLLISTALNLLGVLVCCVGVLVTMSITLLGLGWIYLNLQHRAPPIYATMTEPAP